MTKQVRRCGEFEIKKRCEMEKKAGRVKVPICYVWKGQSWWISSRCILQSSEDQRMPALSALFYPCSYGRTQVGPQEKEEHWIMKKEHDLAFNRRRNTFSRKGPGEISQEMSTGPRLMDWVKDSGHLGEPTGNDFRAHIFQG